MKTLQGLPWIQICVWVLTAGIAWGTYRTTVNWVENRLAKIEAVDVSRLRWQVEANTTSIGTLQGDQKLTTQQIADIRAKLDVLSTKLDNIIEILKGRERGNNKQ